LFSQDPRLRKPVLGMTINDFWKEGMYDLLIFFKMTDIFCLLNATRKGNTGKSIDKIHFNTLLERMSVVNRSIPKKPLNLI
jgi:hypothetical protein